MKILFTILLLLSTTCFAQQWTLQCPWPTGDDLLCSSFPDSAHGWVGGPYGLILRTTDGGASWTQQFGGDYALPPILSLFFHDANNGWALGYSTLLKTTDGGETWTEQPVGQNLDGGSLVFTSAQNGWIIGRPVLHTTTGGAIWNVVNPGIESRFGVPRGWFLNNDFGWLIGSDSLSRTTDGGQTWIVSRLPGDRYVSDCFFTSPDSGWVTQLPDPEGGRYDGRILHTADGGQTWTPQLADTFASFWQILFTDAVTGSVIGNGMVWHTANAGAEWVRHVIPGNRRLQHISTDRHGGLWAVGQGGTMLYSPDRNWTWSPRSNSPAAEYSSIVAADDQYAWAGGAYDLILRTTDGGRHWQPCSLPGSHSVMTGMANVGRTHVWAATAFSSYSGNVLHSADGGLTWEAQFDNFILPMSGIAFPTRSAGWAIGGGGIYHTTDGGDNWTNVYSQSSGVAVFFLDSLHGWVSAGNQTILRTTDGGQTWSSHEGGEALTDIAFTDPLNGFAIAASRLLYRSADGGATWLATQVSGEVYFRAVHFADANHGWLASETNVWATTDAGDTWERLLDHDIENFFIYDAAIASAGSGWLVGVGGILHYAGPTAAAPQRGNRPGDYALAVYPNPFNPATHITFDLPQAARVQVRIFDVTGRLVKTLTDERLAAGSHTLAFDGGNLPSGVYFARLSAENHARTVKLLLLK